MSIFAVRKSVGEDIVDVLGTPPELPYHRHLGRRFRKRNKAHTIKIISLSVFHLIFAVDVSNTSDSFHYICISPRSLNPAHKRALSSPHTKQTRCWSCNPTAPDDDGVYSCVASDALHLRKKNRERSSPLVLPSPQTCTCTGTCHR